MPELTGKTCAGYAFWKQTWIRDNGYSSRPTSFKPHRSSCQWEDAIRNYLKLNNVDPKPFIRTKSADEIMASIERCCLGISNSGH